MMLPRCDSVAALYCTFTTVAIFFFLGAICLESLSLSCFAVLRCCLPCSDLADLVEGELDRRLAAEDRHEHLELLGIRVDLAHRGGKRSERPVHHGNGLVHLEVYSCRPHGLC